MRQKTVNHGVAYTKKGWETPPEDEDTKVKYGDKPDFCKATKVTVEESPTPWKE